MASSLGDCEPDELSGSQHSSLVAAPMHPPNFGQAPAGVRIASTWINPLSVLLDL